MSFEFSAKFSEPEVPVVMKVNKSEERKGDESVTGGKKPHSVAPPSNLLHSYKQFFVDRNEEITGRMDINPNDVGRKLKNCFQCKNNKTNHVVRDFPNAESNVAEDEIAQMVLNMTPRECIEQIVFDPKFGIVKREIHFGIIDFVMVIPSPFILSSFYRPMP